MNLDRIVTILSVLADFAAAWIYLDATHFSAEEGREVQIDIQRQVEEINVDRDSKILQFYQRKQDSGEELSTYELRRLQQVQRDLERGQNKLDILSSKQ